MSDDTKDPTAVALMHSAGIGAILDGLERLADARLVTAAYIARAGHIMATLRKHGRTDATEIEACAELFSTLALDDSRTGRVHNDAGEELLTDDQRQKAH